MGKGMKMAMRWNGIGRDGMGWDEDGDKDRYDDGDTATCLELPHGHG